MLYPIIPILVAAFAMVRGFRKGALMQVPQLIGVAFGIVCVHILREPAVEIMGRLTDMLPIGCEERYARGVMASGLLFLIVYEVFSWSTGFLHTIFRFVPTGILNDIFGSACGLFRYLLFLSVGYNIMFCVKPDERLIRYATSDDGNIVEVTMLMQPAVLGGEGVTELAHRMQLEEAKKIS